MTDPIWTLEARDSVMLEVVTSLFNLSPEAVRREIAQAHEITVEAIAAKGIDYSKLDKALTPQRKRLERAFLFDTARIQSGSYGSAVADVVLPLLPPTLSCSIQLGDLILERDLQDRGIELLNDYAELIHPVELVNTNQIYCIYLNNLSKKMAADITEGLRDYEGFVGHVEASTASPMKDWLSITLVDGYLKHGRAMLNGHEDDAPNTEDRNMKGWPLEENGYECRSIQDMYFHLFLGYKIERRVVPGAEGDTDFALSAISGKPLPLDGVDVEIEAAKAKYLREDHGLSLARAGLASLDDEEIASTIRSKIKDSYIYNLRYDEEHDTSLFNIMLEISEPDEGRVTRLLAALEYQPEVPMLRLVTLF